MKKEIQDVIDPAHLLMGTKRMAPRASRVCQAGSPAVFSCRGQEGELEPFHSDTEMAADTTLSPKQPEIWKDQPSKDVCWRKCLSTLGMPG